MGYSTYPGVCGADEGDQGAIDSTPGPMCRYDDWRDQVCVDNSDTPGPIGTDDRADATPNLPTPPDALDTTPSNNVLTPVDFMNQFLALDVPYFDPETSERRYAHADIHLYTNQGPNHPTRHSNLTEKDNINRGVRRAVRDGQPQTPITPDNAHRGRISKAFYGKGLPNDYRLALMYAIAFGHTTVAAIQDYVYTNAILGMDCIGFVNNFLLQINAIERERTIPSHLQHGRRRRTIRESQADIQPNDLLIWNGDDGEASSHIAIIDTVSNGGTNLLVVESSGTGPVVANGNIGLGSSNYTVRNPIQDSPGSYRVNRGALRNNQNSNVIILGVPSN